jgi:hypothetical protein
MRETWRRRETKHDSDETQRDAREPARSTAISISSLRMCSAIICSVITCAWTQSSANSRSLVVYSSGSERKEGKGVDEGREGRGGESGTRKMTVTIKWENHDSSFLCLSRMQRKSCQWAKQDIRIKGYCLEFERVGQNRMGIWKSRAKQDGQMQCESVVKAGHRKEAAQTK